MCIYLLSIHPSPYIFQSNPHVFIVLVHLCLCCLMNTHKPVEDQCAMLLHTLSRCKASPHKREEQQRREGLTASLAAPVVLLSVVSTLGADAVVTHACSSPSTSPDSYCCLLLTKHGVTKELLCITNDKNNLCREEDVNKK